MNVPGKKWDVVAVGDVFTDIILSDFAAWPRPGEESFAGSYRREIGGGAAITACGLARLGVDAALLAVVGAKDGDDWLADQAGARGVDVSGVRRDPHEPTGLTVSVSTPEERALFTYFGANRTLSDLLADDAVRGAMTQARHVHLACAPESRLLIDVAGHLRSRNVSVSLDVGWQEKWLGDAESRNALKSVDLFMPNEKEAKTITNEEEPSAIMHTFAQMGLRGVALKLGEKGAALLWDGNTHVVETPAVEAVDTTGAGDCFNAGFIYGLLHNESPGESLRMACVCGALSTRSLGGVASFPTRDELAAETNNLRAGV